MSALPKVGDVVTARVKTIAQHGAWIEWDGHVALVLIPDVSDELIRHPRDVLNLGQEVKARIVVVTMDTPPKIRASIKDAKS